MMLHNLVVHKLSGHATSGKVGKINKKAGDTIASGDIVLVIESEKGTVKITSEVEGVLKTLTVAEGDKVEKGQVIGTIEGEKVAGVAKGDKKKSYSFGLAAPKKVNHTADVAIVGGGPGGYVAAIRAAQQGKKVVLIEKERLGGTCLNWGCIPTKALVSSVELLEKMHRACEFGLIADNIGFDVGRIMKRKDQVVDTLVEGIEYLMETHEIITIQGTAEVQDETTLVVKNKKLDATIVFEHLIIATGSKPFRLPIPGAEAEDLLDNRGLLSLEKAPASMVIIGGGVIGMEFAFLYNALGTEVHVVEFLPQILNLLDEDVVEVIGETAREKGIHLHEATKALSIEESLDGKKIVTLEKEGARMLLTSERVAMAVGRRAALDALDLEKLGVKLNEKGSGIEVDEHMCTSNPKIYAIGDVTNILQLAHVASHQGIVAADHLSGVKASMHYDGVPSAIFTMPPVGQVGLTEKEAIAKNIPYQLGIFPFAANGKAQALGETKGFVKLLADPESRVLLGATIVGVHATDLISTVGYLMASKKTIDEAAHVIVAHPTTAESIHEALLSVDKRGIHFA